MGILKVENLQKRYEKFALKDVSFSLEQGYIMGFIGRNGAGKTTTIKSMLNLVHADGGRVEMFGKDFRENEFDCKQNMSLMLGGVDYYPKKKLKTIASVVKRFYCEWSDEQFAGYMQRFELDAAKRVEQLSAGMKVKFGLALAMSHNARLLILDEPTSGLDPVSREDLLDVFRALIEDGERSILFSTHITSDLEKCADYITYIKDGAVFASMDKDAFKDEYRLVSGKNAQMAELKGLLIGAKENAFGFTALAKTADMPRLSALESAPADLESIMVHIEKE